MNRFKQATAGDDMTAVRQQKLKIVMRLLGIGAGLTAGMHAWAADIPAELRIDQVTVYAQGAMVSRTGSVNFPVGSHRLILRDLPAGIDSRLLRVSIGSNGVASNAVRLGSVEVTTINAGQFVSPRERELRTQLETKTDQRAAIQDEIDTAQTQLKLLESLAANPTGGANGNSAVNGANLTAVLSTLGNSAAAARTKVRDAKLKQRTIDRDIETIKAELAKVATARKQSTEVSAAIDVSAATTVPVTVTYRVNDASWSWVYQARLDTSNKKLSLERQGQVQQGSGEDWNNVQLTLTTAQPEGDVATPTVVSEFLDLQVPQPPQPFVRRDLQKSAMAAAPAADGLQLEEAVVTSVVKATQYLVEYQVPQRVSLNADRQTRMYPISDETFATNIVARIMPSEVRRAYLEATFKYERDVPIEAGQLQLYRDGAFVGEAETQAFLPGAEVRMPFGVDERIKVAVRDESAKSNERGVLSKQVTRETKQRFEITSYHSTSIPVEVVDRMPVSKNADIKVEILQGATEPTTKDLNGKAGVLLWKFDAQPQQMTTIRHYYSVRYPRDRILESSYESE